MQYIYCAALGFVGMLLGLCVFAAVMRLRRKRRRGIALEFSKQILKAVAVGTILIVLFTCYMVWVTRDLTPLAYVIPSVFLELSVGTAFYYNKAKAENEIKLQRNLPHSEQEESQ